MYETHSVSRILLTVPEHVFVILKGFGGPGTVSTARNGFQERFLQPGTVSRHFGAHWAGADFCLAQSWSPGSPPFVFSIRSAGCLRKASWRSRKPRRHLGLKVGVPIWHLPVVQVGVSNASSQVFATNTGQCPYTETVKQEHLNSLSSREKSILDITWKKITTELQLHRSLVGLAFFCSNWIQDFQDHSSFNLYCTDPDTVGVLLVVALALSTNYFVV